MNWRRRTTALIVLICVVIGIGLVVFRASDRITPPDGQTPSAGSLPRPQGPAPSTATTARLRSRSAVLEAIDAPNHGWQSETFHEATSTRLERIGQWIAGREHFDAADVAEIVGDGFSCSDLNPAKLDEVFSDRTIRVDRGNPQASGRTHRGAAGLADALHDLVRSFKGAADVRIAFKQFRVDLKQDGASTTDYYAASGRTKDRVIEQHAVWRCRWERRDGAPPRLLSLTVSDFEQSSANGRALFADCTEAVLARCLAYEHQLRHGLAHWNEQIEYRAGIGFMGHHGVTLGDVNGDGLEDVYLSQGGGLPNLLLTQNEDGTVTDISEQASVDFLDATSNALIVDLDNDGDQDLVLAIRTDVLFLSNDGAARFKVRAAMAGITDAFSLAAADYDGDGDLDVYACRYYPTADGERLVSPVPYHDANNGPPNVLLRNEGAWRFADATVETGLDANNQRWSFAAAWEDYDDDGDVDLYVANDFGRNCLYRNDGSVDGKWHFVDVAADSGVEDVASGMSVTWGDYDRDGRMDLYVSNMFSSAGGRIAYQRRFRADAPDETRRLIQRLARGNSLFENLGDGSFGDVSIASATTMGRWAWSSNFVDVNNDGWEDLVVANGHITGEDTGDL